MSNELIPQNIKEAPEVVAGGTVLEVDEIQGDVGNAAFGFVCPFDQP
jgi:hypothetical protein